MNYDDKGTLRAIYCIRKRISYLEEGFHKLCHANIRFQVPPPTSAYDQRVQGLFFS